MRFAALLTYLDGEFAEQFGRYTVNTSVALTKLCYHYLLGLYYGSVMWCLRLGQLLVLYFSFLRCPLGNLTSRLSADSLDLGSRTEYRAITVII